MQDDNVAPINHTAFSAFGTQAAGTVGGAFKGGVSSYIITTGICAAIGAVMMLSGFGWIPAFLGGGQVMGAVWTAVVGTVAGGVVGGALVAPVVGLFGGAAGAVHGGSKASARVRNEQSAATQLQAQVEVAKAQAMAQSATTNVYAPSASNNKYDFPEQGSPMNPASTKFLAAGDNAYLGGDRAQALGTVNSGLQLQQG